MSRQVTEQYATFWFAIDERVADDETSYDDLYPVWKRASELVEERSNAHPMRFEKVQERDLTLDVERWELCEPESYLENREGMTGWPVSFYLAKEFAPEVLRVLKDLCVTAMAEAASQYQTSARFLQASTYTVYRETQSAVIEGL